MTENRASAADDGPDHKSQSEPSNNPSPISRLSNDFAAAIRALTQPSEEVEAALRAITEPSKETQAAIRALTQPSEEVEAALRAITEPSAELQQILRNFAAPSEQLAATIRDLTQPAGKLIPESMFDDEDDEATEAPIDKDQAPDAIAKLSSILAEAGRECTLSQSTVGDSEHLRLEFSLPAGRDERLVSVNEEDATALIESAGFLSWRSLSHYNGIWNQETFVIEAVIRGGLLGPNPRHLLRLLNRDHDNDANKSVEFQDVSSRKRIVLGKPSPGSSAFLFGMRRPRNLPLTVRLEGYEASTTEQAERILERITDAFFFDIEVNQGIGLVLSHLESGDRPLRWKPAHSNAPSYPSNQYPHAPRLLFRLGRDRHLPPVIRYWALYQVLEYFFPRYANEEAIKRVSRHVRSPSFDPHRDEDIVKTISLAGHSQGASERQHLIYTLQAITGPSELREVIEQLHLGDALGRGGDQLSGVVVKTQSDDVVHQLAHRIYDVRCKIVHSKSDGGDDLGPGLLAGTTHDDLVQPELPLMEYLAHQAIISAAEPIH